MSGIQISAPPAAPPCSLRCKKLRNHNRITGRYAPIFPIHDSRFTPPSQASAGKHSPFTIRKEPGGSFLFGVTGSHYEENTKMSAEAMRNNSRNTVDFAVGNWFMSLKFTWQTKEIKNHSKSGLQSGAIRVEPVFEVSQTQT
jgi:hypothetical protein